MARKIKQVNKEVMENLVKKSFLHIGVTVDENQANLFLRLFIGAVSDYFFRHPDNEINVGFIKLKKNPEKKELFVVELLPNETVGVINASTLFDYYTGDLGSAEELKQTMENFVNELLNYSQVQNNNITVLTSQLKGRRNEDGI